MKLFISLLSVFVVLGCFQSEPVEAKTHFNVGLNFDFIAPFYSRPAPVRQTHYYYYAPQPAPLYVPASPVIIPSHPTYVVPSQGYYSHGYYYY